MGRRVALAAVASIVMLGLLGCGAGHHGDTSGKTTTRQAIYVNPVTGKPAERKSNTATGPRVYLIPSAGKLVCGYLDVGIGWRVTVANGVSCTKARRIMLSTITRRPCLTHGSCHVQGYRYSCRAGPGDTNESESVFCTQRSRMVAAAISNS
jgi:hypothetical protein